MRTYKRIIEKKENGRYVNYGTINTDEEVVMACFAEDMRNKYLRGSSSYIRVEYRNNCNGTETVKFSHNNGYRTTYIIPSGMLNL